MRGTCFQLKDARRHQLSNPTQAQNVRACAEAASAQLLPGRSGEARSFCLRLVADAIASRALRGPRRAAIINNDAAGNVPYKSQSELRTIKPCGASLATEMGRGAT